MKQTAMTIRVTKTIQEQQYEPFTVEVTMTLESIDGVISNTDIKDAYAQLEGRVDKIMESRVAKLVQPATYGQ